MENNKKVGILAGSFNPPHDDHFNIAGTAWREADLNQIWFLPLNNPLKNPEDYVSPEHIREMLLAGIDWVGDSDYCFPPNLDPSTLRNPTAKEVCSTLKVLNPDCDFWWITGSDCLWTLPKWKNWQELLDPNLRLIIVHRPETNPLFAPLEVLKEIQKRCLPENIIYALNDRNENISSSKIREALKGPDYTDNVFVRCNVPYPVRQYIKEHNLYR